MQADLIVVGAGPAGMAATATAAEKGLRVLILDEQPRAGGQIYRDVERSGSKRIDILGQDYLAGLPLAEGLAEPGITHVTGATVWQIEPDGTVAYSVDGRAAMAYGRRLLLATGALERSMPVPGWTLPGVMTAGAGQILLKESGVVATRAVLAGSGPLLYLIGAQMIRAGKPPLAMVETQSRSDLFGAMRYIGGAIRGWRYLAKGLGLLAEIRKAGVPRYTAASQIAVEGTDRVEALDFVSGGKRHRIECQTVFLHHGVVPNTQASRSLDLPHRWDSTQACFIPETDAWGRSEISTVFVAGDGAGIGGAKVAEHAGRLVAVAVAHDLQQISTAERDRAAASICTEYDKDQAVRPFLDHAYPPYAGALQPADDTIVCRCEEVTAADVRRYASLGCKGPNQTKAFGRPGMGPCQGRYCGLTVTSLLAKETGQDMDQTGYFRIRPPLKPVTLGELAAMDETPEPSAGETQNEA